MEKVYVFFYFAVVIVAMEKAKSSFAIEYIKMQKRPMIGLAFFHWRYPMPQNHMQIRHLRHKESFLFVFSFHLSHGALRTVFSIYRALQNYWNYRWQLIFQMHFFSLSFSISSNRSNFFPFYLHWFFVFDAIKSIAMHSEISEMKELHRKLFLGDISTFD